jgi:hypothetical protein
MAEAISTYAAWPGLNAKKPVGEARFGEDGGTYSALLFPPLAFAAHRTIFAASVAASNSASPSSVAPPPRDPKSGVPGVGRKAKDQAIDADVCKAIGLPVDSMAVFDNRAGGTVPRLFVELEERVVRRVTEGVWV